MQLIYANHTGQDIPEGLFRAILERVPTVTPEATHEHVELLLTDDAAIHELNKTYRDKDKPTDVLSFPVGDEVSLGQIVISLDTATRQATELGQSLEDELQFLFPHGVLHLLGYDHEEPEEEKLMLEKAYAILGRKN